jgi:hypothetical protein
MSDLTDQGKFEVQLEWLKEQGADLRARTQAEYLYTAAALAFYGGVCWGVATLPKSGWLAVIVVVIVALLIAWKIDADHWTYRRIWIARGIIIKRLDEELSLEASFFPEPKDDDPLKWPFNFKWLELGKWLTDWLTDKVFIPNTPKGLRGEPGPGYLISIVIVVGAGFVAALFCCGLWFYAGSPCTL